MLNDISVEIEVKSRYSVGDLNKNRFPKLGFPLKKCLFSFKNNISNSYEKI